MTQNKWMKRQSNHTSATTPIQPAMTAAFACAPLIPPRPAVTKTYKHNIVCCERKQNTKANKEQIILFCKFQSFNRVKQINRLIFPSEYFFICLRLHIKFTCKSACVSGGNTGTGALLQQCAEVPYNESAEIAEMHM